MSQSCSPLPIFLAQTHYIQVARRNWEQKFPELQSLESFDRTGKRKLRRDRKSGREMNVIIPKKVLGLGVGQTLLTSLKILDTYRLL